MPATFIGTLFGLFLATTAYGAPTISDCTSTSDTPIGWSTLTCDTGGSAVCSYGGGDFSCDLKINGDTAAGKLAAVSRYNQNDIVVWGTDGDANDFCCVVDDPSEEVEIVLMYGTSQADTITLTVTPSSNTYNLEDIHPPQLLAAIVFGDDGDDTVHGSDSKSAYYLETLSGGDGADYIDGHAGVDEIHGDGDDDILLGGDGNDYIRGGGKDDDIAGGSGADTIYGDAGVDTIAGGTGDDVIHCGAGASIIVPPKTVMR